MLPGEKKCKKVLRLPRIARFSMNVMEKGNPHIRSRHQETSIPLGASFQKKTTKDKISLKMLKRWKS